MHTTSSHLRLSFYVWSEAFLHSWNMGEKSFLWLHPTQRLTSVPSYRALKKLNYLPTIFRLPADFFYTLSILFAALNEIIKQQR